MSHLIHCDGPDCDQARDVESIASRALFERGWLKVSQGEGVRSLDFHSNQCLADWNAQQQAEPNSYSTFTNVTGQ